MIRIRSLTPDDWTRAAEIYAAGIASGNATFETEVPEWDAWDSSHMTRCRLIAQMGEEVAGWAALSPVSSRCVYAGVAEVSVYVDPAFAGRGVGTRLLTELIERSEADGIWTLRAGVFPANTASLRLHEKCGFRVLGTQERIGRMPDGRWRDVVAMERRSRVVGWP